jgi:hypothetical protein
VEAGWKAVLKDDRQGKFQLSWYENRQKQWQDVKGRVSDRELPYLSDAVAQADDKLWLLSNRHRQVADPTSEKTRRKKMAVEVQRYRCWQEQQEVSAHAFWDDSQAAYFERYLQCLFGGNRRTLSRRSIPLRPLEATELQT